MNQVLEAKIKPASTISTGLDLGQKTQLTIDDTANLVSFTPPSQMIQCLFLK